MRMVWEDRQAMYVSSSWRLLTQQKYSASPYFSKSVNFLLNFIATAYTPFSCCGDACILSNQALWYEQEMRRCRRKRQTLVKLTNATFTEMEKRSTDAIYVIYKHCRSAHTGWMEWENNGKNFILKMMSSVKIF